MARNSSIIAAMTSTLSPRGAASPGLQYSTLGTSVRRSQNATTNASHYISLFLDNAGAPFNITGPIAKDNNNNNNNITIFYTLDSNSTTSTLTSTNSSSALSNSTFEVSLTGVGVTSVYDDMPYDEDSNWFNDSCAGLRAHQESFLKSILEPVISCCGIVGILLTMVVLSRKTMCTSTNCYLTALAVADLLFLVILSIRNMVEKLEDCEFYLGDERTIFQVYSIILMDTFQYLTVGVTVMLAVERYIAICHPMRAMLLCSVKRARIIIVVLTVIAFILRSPKFLDLEIRVVELQNGEKITTATWVELYDDKLYNYIVTAGLLTILPLTALMILNIRLIVEIKRSSRYLQYHLGTDSRVRSVVNKEEMQITVMLVSVIIVFFVCHMPYMVHVLIMALNGYQVQKDEWLVTLDDMLVFKHVAHILLALKSSGNFILYCWFSEKFWATFMRIFCLRHCLPKQTNHQQPNGCHSHNHAHSSQNNLHRPSWYITKETTC